MDIKIEWKLQPNTNNQVSKFLIEIEMNEQNILVI